MTPLLLEQVLYLPSLTDSTVFASEELLRFNSVRVEIRELRPEVVAEGEGVLVHYRSRTNVWQRLSAKTLA